MNVIHQEKSSDSSVAGFHSPMQIAGRPQVLMPHHFRVGNLVWDVKKDKPHKIYLENLLLLSRDKGAFCKRYAQIKVNEARLLHAGFEEAENDNGLSLVRGGFHFFFDRNNDFYLNGVCVDVKVIHTLQNIHHSLTSYELTVNLE